MPQVRLFNPPRKRRRPLAGAALAAHRRRVGNKPRRNPRTINMRPKRRRNAGTFAYVANFRKHRRRNPTQVMVSRPRKSNPRVVYRYQRRSNPMEVKGTLETVLYAGVGGILTR